MGTDLWVEIHDSGRQYLCQAFTTLHISNQQIPSKTKSIERNSCLTVGARALCKHSHRSSEGYWGICKGPESVKNDIALSKLLHLLDQCVWINLHKMSGTNTDETIIEIRESQGYGARWTWRIESGQIVDMKFRGFVEPMMVNGHEVGWRH